VDSLSDLNSGTVSFTVYMYNIPINEMATLMSFDNASFKTVL